MFMKEFAGSILEASACLQCHDAPCTRDCPAGVDCKRFIGLVQKGDYASAADVIAQDNPFGEICGYICPISETCQKSCTSSRFNRPISIRTIQTFAMQNSRSIGWHAQCIQGDAVTIRLHNGEKLQELTFSADGHGKVAVIGGGPGGLSAAHYLKKLGYEVTVFEATDKLGGRLTHGIPDFRLPHSLVEEHCAELTAGMDVQYRKRLGRDFTVQELLDNGWRAVVLATGKHRAKTLELPGANEDVYLPDEILCGDCWKQRKHRRAVVLGGGNVAVDVARVLKNAGIEHVSICYRGTTFQIKALAEEREASYQDGITLQLHAQPYACRTENGRLQAVQFHRTETVGKNALETVCLTLESDFEIPADMMVYAVGFEVNTEDFAHDKGIAFDNGHIHTQGTRTSIKHVYAVGDLAGGRSVIQAIADGKSAAVALHTTLRKTD